MSEQPDFLKALEDDSIHGDGIFKDETEGLLIGKKRKQLTRELLPIDIATHLYALEVARPVPINEPPPDYDAIAQKCVARARETAPYLIEALEA